MLEEDVQVDKSRRAAFFSPVAAVASWRQTVPAETILNFSFRRRSPRGLSAPEVLPVKKRETKKEIIFDSGSTQPRRTGIYEPHEKRES